MKVIEPNVTGSATKERKRKRKVDANSNNNTNNTNNTNNSPVPTTAQFQTIAALNNNGDVTSNKNFKWDYPPTSLNNQQPQQVSSSNIKKQLVNSSPGKPFATQQQHVSAFNQTNPNATNIINNQGPLTNMVLNTNTSAVMQQQHNHNSHSQSPLHFNSVQVNSNNNNR